MTRFLIIPLLTTLVAAAALNAQPPGRSPGAIMPGQLPTSSLGVIARDQGIDGRFFGAPRLDRRPFPVAFPFYRYGYYPQPPVIVIREVVREVPPANRPDRRLNVPPPVAEPVDPDRATLVLKVPEDAEVWLDGQKMEGQSGPERTFTTPMLQRGTNYAYRVRVTWGDSGKWEREVTFQAGERKSLLILGR